MHFCFTNYFSFPIFFEPDPSLSSHTPTISTGALTLLFPSYFLTNTSLLPLFAPADGSNSLAPTAAPMNGTNSPSALISFAPTDQFIPSIPTPVGYESSDFTMTVQTAGSGKSSVLP